MNKYLKEREFKMTKKEEAEWIKEWKKKRENKKLVEEWVEIDTELYEKVEKEAERLGVSTEDLLNLYMEMSLKQAINDKLELKLKVHRDSIRYTKSEDDERN